MLLIFFQIRSMLILKIFKYMQIFKENPINGTVGKSTLNVIFVLKYECLRSFQQLEMIYIQPICRYLLQKTPSSLAQIMLISVHVILHFIILLLIKIIFSATEKHSQAIIILPQFLQRNWQRGNKLSLYLLLNDVL